MMGVACGPYLPVEYFNMTEKTVEQEIQEKGLNAPRVTPQQIENAIVREEFHVFADSTLTVCCLTLRNGFKVTGESGCASPENYNKTLGERIAREDATRKIWALEGYLLKDRQSRPAAA